LSEKSLKREYTPWLWALLLVDTLAIAALLVPGLLPFGASAVDFAKSRLIATAVAPILVLLLVNVLSNEWKCVLVYWRPYGWLPGREAFTKHALEDPRIDVAQFRKHVGEFPTDPREQNARWYALYKVVEDAPAVRDAQRNFLMYRDMAALSLPFIGIAPFWLYHANATPEAQWLAALLCAAQYLFTAISSKNSGVRFVRTVLALHSARKIAPRKAK
jgi:hypothetical protein